MSIGFITLVEACVIVGIIDGLIYLIKGRKIRYGKITVTTVDWDNDIKTAQVQVSIPSNIDFDKTKKIVLDVIDCREKN